MSVSAFIWKRLDGQHTIEDIHQELRAGCDDVPDTAAADIRDFLKDLEQKGYAGRQWDGHD